MNALSEVSKWLDVLGSVDHNINSLPMNVLFCDISCDSDYKLVIGDLGTSNSNNNPKLKVFKGGAMINEIILPDVPTSVMSFFTNESLPRNPPVVAVSMCSSVFIYKNMKLFYKFYLPLLEVSSLEIDIWRKLTEYYLQDDDNLIQLIEKLSEIPFSTLTSQSQYLLSLPPDKYMSFIKQYNDFPIQKSSVITCMTTLNMNSIEKSGVACLILGTENGDIIILDPHTFSILCQARVNNSKATPSHIEASGLFDVDYRIIIATREGLLCLLRREWVEGKCLVQISSPVVEMLIMPGDSSIVVATINKTLQLFNKKGKRSWSLSLPHYVTTIALVQLAHLGINLVAVAMIDGLIQFYNGKNLVDTISTQDTISIIKFGQLGQEENVLTLITSDGALILKILKRTADFNINTTNNLQKSHPSHLAAQQSRPLLVPKKSKLFLEQANREREQYLEMHDTFQRELCQLRLYVAKETVESIKNANNSLSTSSSEPLKLTAKVEGLGPVFKIFLSIENLSADKPIANLFLLFVMDQPHYKISTPYIPLPMLIPGSPYTFLSKVTELFNFIDETSIAEYVQNREELQADRPPLRVVLIKEGRAQPLLTATIYMPLTDPLMIPFS